MIQLNDLIGITQQLLAAGTAEDETEERRKELAKLVSTLAKNSNLSKLSSSIDTMSSKAVQSDKLESMSKETEKLLCYKLEAICRAN